jgi:hypothetical protein
MPLIHIPPHNSDNIPNIHIIIDAYITQVTDVCTGKLSAEQRDILVNIILINAKHMLANMHHPTS